jgi:hypothetical protein
MGESSRERKCEFQGKYVITSITGVAQAMRAVYDENISFVPPDVDISYHGDLPIPLVSRSFSSALTKYF